MHHLPGPHRKALAECEKLKDYIRERVELHKLTLDPSCPRDYIDCFLLRAEKVEVVPRGVRAALQTCLQMVLNPLPTTSLQGKSSPDTMYSNEDLVMSVFSLFGAGTVTTSNTLVFFLLVLAKYPHIQGKGSKMQLFPMPEEAMVQQRCRQRVPALEVPVQQETKIILLGSPKGDSHQIEICTGQRVVLPVLAHADGPELAHQRCLEP